MTTWMDRFQHALAIMCGSLPPIEMCQEWVDHIEVNGQYRLQNWIFSKGNKTPQWAQAIVTIDAAQLWADGPEEGAGHAQKPKESQL
jgi:hypothetical protein